MLIASGFALSVRRDADFKWVVVRSKPQQERVAVQHLVQRGVDPYCPMIAEPRWHRRAPSGPVPLFKGYLFVRCDVVNRMNAVRFCPGILGPVVFGTRVATVQRDVIDALRRREGERGFLLTREEAEGIPMGKNVRIMEGPLKGLEGVFNGYLRGDERALVLLHFLRCRKAVEVDTACLMMVVP